MAKLGYYVKIWKIDYNLLSYSDFHMGHETYLLWGYHTAIDKMHSGETGKT